MISRNETRAFWRSRSALFTAFPSVLVAVVLMRPLRLVNSRNARVSGGAGLGLALEGLGCKLELEPCT